MLLSELEFILLLVFEVYCYKSILKNPPLNKCCQIKVVLQVIPALSLPICEYVSENVGHDTKLCKSDNAFWSCATVGAGGMGALTIKN